MKDLLRLTAVAIAISLTACGGNSRAVPVTEVRINTDERSLPQVRSAASQPSTSLSPSVASAQGNVPSSTAPSPVVEAPPACSVKPPAAAASAQVKLKSRQLTLFVHAIFYADGVCRIYYADGDNEDSLAAAPEICDANPCLQIGHVFRARLRLIDVDVPCAGASFCVNGPTYRDRLVVELRPQ